MHIFGVSCCSYNHLLNVIHKSLEDLVNVLKGLVVMSGDLENMANSLYDNIVPEIWAKKVFDVHLKILFDKHHIVNT